MKVSGWGHYPVVNARLSRPCSQKDILSEIQACETSENIARGLGRSYGDSSLAQNIIETTQMDQVLDFNEATGILTCSAGVSLATILGSFVNKGWFLPVSPGTKFVTVGGAIASDVHGKNHHQNGTFSDHVISISIATVSEGIIFCDRTSHSQLFRATCGGMGLTGIIVEAQIKLMPLQSTYIDQQTIKTGNLDETLDLFESHSGKHYSIDWIDCLSVGKQLGRSLLMLGEHYENGSFHDYERSSFRIPTFLPSCTLNKYTVRTFNSFYYHRSKTTHGNKSVHYEDFFYPLDRISNWNFIYGRDGFVQYQFVVPEASGLNTLKSILKKVSDSGLGSFLSVLKKFGPSNDNYISFPFDGYTLALDFKIHTRLFDLLDHIDKIVLSSGGRIYLSKDSRMSERTFKESYPEWEKFMEVRKAYKADKVFNSAQSIRLGL